MKIVEIEADSDQQEFSNTLEPENGHLYPSQKLTVGGIELKVSQPFNSIQATASIGENTLDSHFRGSSFGKYSGQFFNSMVYNSSTKQRTRQHQIQ
jgi:hypothetical protein